MTQSKNARTLDMFNIPNIPKPEPGTANYSVQASARLSQMLDKAKLHGKDRYEIACEISRLTGLNITKSTLDKWASMSSTDHNIPFYLVPLLEAICEETDLCDWHSEMLGGEVTYGVDVLNTRLGKLKVLQNRLNSEIKDITAALGEVE